jgi:hypothetical protein
VSLAKHSFWLDGGYDREDSRLAALLVVLWDLCATPTRDGACGHCMACQLAAIARENGRDG